MEINEILKKIKEDVKKQNNEKEDLELDLSINKDNIYQEFSPFKSDLNNDLYQYVEDKYRFDFRNRNLKINFIGLENNFNKEEQENIISSFKNHYWEEMKIKTSEIKRTIGGSFALLFIGLILLSIYVTFSFLKYEYSEIISIFAWVFVWEACDKFTFTNLSLRKERLKFAKIYNATYSFKEDDDGYLS